MLIKLIRSSADVLSGVFLYCRVFMFLVLNGLISVKCIFNRYDVPFMSYFLTFWCISCYLIMYLNSIAFNFLISAYTCLCIMFPVFCYYRQQQNSPFKKKKIGGWEEKTLQFHQELQWAGAKWGAHRRGEGGEWTVCGGRRQWGRQFPMAMGSEQQWYGTISF